MCRYGLLDLQHLKGLLLLTNEWPIEALSSNCLRAACHALTAAARITVKSRSRNSKDLIEGVEIDGMRYGAIDANLERGNGPQCVGWNDYTEAKNRLC